MFGIKTQLVAWLSWVGVWLLSEVFSSIPSSNKTTLLLFLPVSQHGKNSPFNYEMIIILLKNFDKFYNLY